MEKERLEEEYDFFERAIRKTGCWKEHLACAECMGHTKDWRECQEESENLVISGKQSISSEEAMLPKLFAEFVIDSDDYDVNNRLHPNYIDPHVYVPLDRSPRWFLDDNLTNSNNKTREIVQNRAAFAYLQGDYITAMDIAPINGPQLFFLLQKLHALVSTYDEQLQYWAESLEVYLATGMGTSNYLRNAILLCASTDLPEFWISILKNAPNSCANLRIGSLCRAVCILENLLPSKTRYFDPHNLKLMKAELRGLCSEEKLSEVKAAICADLIRNEKVKTIEVNRLSFSKRVLKDRKAEDVVILEFIHHFYWLFSDVNQQLVNVILQIS
ncbi:unnamed protein product [Acanthocheilonema viteae]|uniref:Uncharacterized protein n=1 Tax=Acanthocheilonema viteae TaxID=6277 RepID=A0A498S5R6_ACAVI|nr:unnamed protein product [Acanthocheilonema viteae]